MRMKFVWSLLVTTTCIFGTTNLAAKAGADDNGAYTAKDKKFDQALGEVLVVRPGLKIEILDAFVPTDMRLEVTYSIKDPVGLPLTHEGLATPGAVDMRLTLANIPMGKEQKVSLASERIDRNGTLTSLGKGEYKYKFDYVMISDQDTTHTLALGGRRDLREWGLDRYADNAIQSWVPSGMYDAVPRDVVTAATCNRCHDPLQMHGRWQSPDACTQCHNPGLVEDGLNLSLDTLIHKVHMGPNLETPLVVGRHDYSKLEYPVWPSPGMKDCVVCHTGGTPTANFPMVATPNPAQVCDMSGLGTTTVSWGDLDPFEIHVGSADGTLFTSSVGEGSQETGKWIKDGTVFVLIDKATGKTVQKMTVNTSVAGCVGNAPGTFRGEAGAQHTNWMDRPSRRACGSCHDDVDFATGENHSEFELIQMDDALCGNCHGADSGEEYDLSVRGAHTPVYKSAQLPGVLVNLIGVTDTDPGDYPTVTFSLASKNGPLDPAALNRVELYMAGPNEDHSFYARERSVVDNAIKAGENWTYTFTTPIPMDAEGSYTISATGRAYVDVDFGFGGIAEDQRDNAENPFLAFAVTDTTAMPRRTVVSDYNCENCHSNLNFHGGSRHDPGICSFCHNPTAIGEDETNGGEVSIHFKYMVHSIHRGENLTKPYSVGSHDYAWLNEDGEIEGLEYPGDLRNCEACHAGNTYQVPDSEGLLPTAAPKALWDPLQPTAAACLSCHDNDDAAVHAYAYTTFFGETCGDCHGEGQNAAVDKVHAR